MSFIKKNQVALFCFFVMIYFNNNYTLTYNIIIMHSKSCFPFETIILKKFILTLSVSLFQSKSITPQLFPKAILGQRQIPLQNHHQLLPLQPLKKNYCLCNPFHTINKQTITKQQQQQSLLLDGGSQYSDGIIM